MMSKLGGRECKYTFSLIQDFKLSYYGTCCGDISMQDHCLCTKKLIMKNAVAY
jgi:hypothetical protein